MFFSLETLTDYSGASLWSLISAFDSENWNTELIFIGEREQLFTW